MFINCEIGHFNSGNCVNLGKYLNKMHWRERKIANLVFFPSTSKYCEFVMMKFKFNAICCA